LIVTHFIETGIHTPHNF
jgi:hypothetical protein